VLSDELSDVFHSVALRAVLAIPAVAIEEHEMKNPGVARSLLDTKNALDSSALSAH